MGISSALKQWKARRFDASRAGRLGSNSVALGFAWRAKNLGGVRRHLECIEEYSNHPIALYPSTSFHDLLSTREQRVAYRDELNDEIVKRHAIFHSHVDPDFIRLSRLAQECGKPWLHTYHLLYFPEDWNNNLQPWQERINKALTEEARHADVCLSVGTWLVDWLQENHGIESRFVPNGVDIEPCDNASAERFTERTQIRDFVLFVNSISGVKNPLAFIEAARRFPDLQFVMIGTNLIQETIEKTFEIELPGNVTALGPLPHQETLDAIAACRLFIMTSHREGLPTVLLEAMAMNKTCLVPAAPWSADAVQSREHGLRYEPGDISDMDAKIREGLTQKPPEQARIHVENTFTWPVIMAELDQIYSSLLN